MKHHSGSFYASEAQKHGLRVENGRGDHVKIYAPVERGYMIVPLHKELATGTECAIKKWFRSAGIVLSILALLGYIAWMA